MPYASVNDLPDQVKDNLPKDKWAQWMQVFNSVYADAVKKHEKNPDIHAIKAAWSVVKKGESRLYLFGNSLLLEGKKVKGVAIHPMATYHPYEFPKVRIYLDDYLERAAPSAIGKPFLLDHTLSLAPENKITNAKWNREKMCVEYEGEVSDDVAEMIQLGKIKGVSVGLDFTKPGGGMLVTDKGVIPYAFGFEEISFLKNLEPGDPQAWVKLAEAMETQEFTVVKFKDMNAFKDDSFRETWLNQDLGIKIVHGILKDGGESYIPAYLLFYKLKGWTSNKIEVWLRDNPQYSPITQADISIVNVPSPLPEKEIKIN